MPVVDLQERLAKGVRVLFGRSGLASEADLAERADLPQEVVDDVLAGRRDDLESTVACLRALGADLNDLLRAMSQLPGPSGVGDSSPVSLLTGLGRPPRPADLLDECRRLVSETSKLLSERQEEEIERALGGLRRAVQGLEELVAGGAQRLPDEAEEAAPASPEEPLSEEEFERALGVLRSLVQRANGEDDPSPLSSGP